MSTENKLTNTLERKSFEYFQVESKRNLIAPFQSLAKFTAVAGILAMILEVRYFSVHSVEIYISRLSAILIAFLLLVISNFNFGKKHPVILIHTLLLSIICSFGVMIYLIPTTIIFNSHIISLIIFIAALFLSWEVSNQIIVAIYYNVVFSVSIIFNSKSITILPNMFESIFLVIVISVMAIVASYINYKFRQDAVIKSFEVSQSEKKFRNLFENSAEGIFQITREGKFTTVNPALIKILGYTNEDEFKKLVLKSDVLQRKSDWELLTKLLEKQGKVRNFRVPFKKKDGDEITVRMNVRTNEDEESGLNVYEGSLQDITQQVQAENEKQNALEALRTEKMKAETAAKKSQQESNFKTIFLASMSHEVRTPMNSVMGFLTLIENDLFESKDELKLFAKDARLAADSLLDIINNILDISKIEAGKMDLDEIEFSINDEIVKA
ncbi:MAG: PAS domain S-box protein, partial [Bacteroidota bacterium]